MRFLCVFSSVRFIVYDIKLNLDNDTFILSVVTHQDSMMSTVREGRAMTLRVSIDWLDVCKHGQADNRITCLWC